MTTALDPSGLAAFLKDRRARLDPSAFGLPSTRRRTPGLRREEVAQRADVSAVWYTWLEQGRGGAPSADVLQRLSDALVLTAAEREHLFLLAQGRPPELRWREPQEVPPHLQRLLDSLETSPAVIKTPVGDVLAWNRAASRLLFDFAAAPPEGRNMVRLMFLDGRLRSATADWEKVARSGVAALRLHASRVGGAEAVADLVADLSARSADFARMWSENDVGGLNEGARTIDHPVAGRVRFDLSWLRVENRPDLYLIVYTPAAEEDVRRVRRLLTSEG